MYLFSRPTTIIFIIAESPLFQPKPVEADYAYFRCFLRESEIQNKFSHNTCCYVLLPLPWLIVFWRRVILLSLPTSRMEWFLLKTKHNFVSFLFTLPAQRQVTNVHATLLKDKIKRGINGRESYFLALKEILSASLSHGRKLSKGTEQPGFCSLNPFLFLCPIEGDTLLCYKDYEQVVPFRLFPCSLYNQTISK
jgi:hypothetical protein